MRYLAFLTNGAHGIRLVTIEADTWEAADATAARVGPVLWIEQSTPELIALLRRAASELEDRQLFGGSLPTPEVIGCATCYIGEWEHDGTEEHVYTPGQVMARGKPR